MGSEKEEGEGLSWTVYKRSDSDLTIIAFEAISDYSDLQPDLVPFYAPGEDKFLPFDLLCHQINPTFSVNSTTISLFRKNYPGLDQLKSTINCSTPLIVTGVGLGGSVACLFTISLLESIQLGKNRPLCITYGSPLVGDKRLQQAISSNPIWNSCFLNVVSLNDPLPRIFITNTDSPSAALTPQTSASYMPFGTFLFFSDVNCICFENPDSILELLVAMCPIHVRNQSQGLQYVYYGNIVENLNHETIYKDFFTLGQSNSVLEGCIGLQLQALALTPHMQRTVLSNPFKKSNQMKEVPEQYKNTLHHKPPFQDTDPSTLQSTMTQSPLFWSGIELAPFVSSSGLLRRSWDVVSCYNEGIISNKGEEGLSWNFYKEPDSSMMIIAFEATVNSSNLHADLIPSSVLREDKFFHFDFLCTKINPNFSVNSTAVSLFRINHHRLDQLKSEINSFTPLIVTGHGLGGSIAALFTISLLDSISSGNNFPLCITYGSPLIGDKKLQQAISSSSIWSSCFLHVVSLEDPLPRLFIANQSSLAAASSVQISAYMPFGTFLFCSNVNSTCFENPDSVLEFLGSIHLQNQGFHYADYGNIVENLNHKAICKDLTTSAENVTCPKSNSILATSMVQALGLTPHMLEKKMKVLEQRFIYQREVMLSPPKELNVMKMEMAQVEMYKRHSKNRRAGYYDSYKNMESSWDREVEPIVKRLTMCWEKMAEEAKIRSQKGREPFPESWLNAGTSYRRLVEPLVIAQYYREGGKDYVTKNRPEHFVLLEKWFWNEMTEAKTNSMEAIRDCDSDWDWDMCRSVVDKAIHSSQGSKVAQEWEDNSMLNITSDYENEEATSAAKCFSFWTRANQFLLSSKGLNNLQENEENLNRSKKNDKDNSYFEACVSEFLLSSQGSDKEENTIKFESHVDEAVLSRQGSIPAKELEGNLNRTRKKNMEALLTSDSCFWARVEEARISCNELKVIKEKEETLVEFEEYVYELLKNYQVSSDIFLPQSSYMCWWNEYKYIKGTSYNSKLANFMNDVRKHRPYSFGDHDFSSIVYN